MTRPISIHHRIQILALAFATLLGLILATPVGAGIVVGNPADTVSPDLDTWPTSILTDPVVGTATNSSTTVDPIVWPDSISAEMLTSSISPPNASPVPPDPTPNSSSFGNHQFGFPPFLALMMAARGGGEVDPEPGNPGDSLACMPGQVKFDGHCLGFRNVESFFNLNSDDTTLLNYEFCYTDDGKTIEGCIRLNVDLGSVGSEHIGYTLIDFSCDTFGPYRAENLCFQGYRIHHRSVHEFDSELSGSESYLVHTITHQVPRFRHAMGFRWQEALVTSQVMEYSGDWSYASGLDAELSWSATNGDGDTLLEDYILKTIIGDGASYITAEDACAAVEKVWVDDGVLIGDLYASSCQDMIDDPDSVEGELPAALFTMRNYTDSNYDLCDPIAESLESAAVDAGANAYQACLNDPEDFFPNLFDESDWDAFPFDF